MLFYVRYGCDNDKNYLIVESENKEQVYDRFMGEADDCFDSVDCGVYEEDFDTHDNYLMALDDARAEQCFCVVEEYDENDEFQVSILEEYGVFEI